MVRGLFQAVGHMGGQHIERLAVMAGPWQDTHRKLFSPELALAIIKHRITAVDLKAHKELTKT